jgi:hypothetical protein
MAEVHLPLSITYETEGITPVEDVITALQATDAITKDAVSLLPSFIEGLRIEKSSLNVRSLSQDSPLREIFFLAVFATWQGELEEEVPKMLEEMFSITVSDDYDTITTVVFLVVVFYGVGMAIDAAKKMVTPSLPRDRYHELADLLARQTHKTPDEIESIVRAHFEKPSAAKRLVTQAKRVFRPSQRAGNAPMRVDRGRIESDLIRQVPYTQGIEKSSDFDRYTPYSSVDLEIHAMDKDKSATGWAAIAPEVAYKRLKMRVMDPVQPSDLWGCDRVVADIVVVSKLSSDGYTPSEIQVTKVYSDT